MIRQAGKKERAVWDLTWDSSSVSVGLSGMADVARRFYSGTAVMATISLVYGGHFVSTARSRSAMN